MKTTTGRILKITSLIAALVLIASLPATLAWYNRQIIEDGAPITAAQFTDVGLAVNYDEETDSTAVTLSANGNGISHAYFVVEHAGETYYTPELSPSEENYGYFEVSYTLSGNWTDAAVTACWGAPPEEVNSIVGKQISEMMPATAVPDPTVPEVQSAETTPEPTETTSTLTETTPEPVESESEQPAEEPTEPTPESTETTPELAESTPESTETTPELAESAPELAESAPELTEPVSTPAESAPEQAAEPTPEPTTE